MYKKLSFNMKVENKIKVVQKDGITSEINNNMSKIDIRQKDIANTSLSLDYIVTVKNTEELEGIAYLEIEMPEGFEITQISGTNAIINGRNILFTTRQLKSNEEQSYTISVEWIPGGENFGTKISTAKIVGTKNNAGFAETSIDDNEDTTQFIISIKTGLDKSLKLISTICCCMSLIAYIVIKKTKKY